MENAEYWQSFFKGWPAGVDRRGVLVVSYGEQIPFDSFMPGADLLLVDRSVPDTIGARKIVIPYRNIAAVKLIDVVRNKLFIPLGFEEPPAKRSSG